MDISAVECSWDEQQTAYLPDRETAFAAVLAVVESALIEPGTVLDVGCGLGSLTRRLLRKVPGTRVTGIDFDPVMLALGHELSPDVRFLARDIREAGWADAEVGGPYDAVMTATALHWLTERQRLDVYRDIASLLRPGGVFADADHTPVSSPTLRRWYDEKRKQRSEAAFAQGALRWDGWWSTILADPALNGAVEARERLGVSNAAADVLLCADDKCRLLRSAGFREAAVVWRAGNEAVVVGLR